MKLRSDNPGYIFLTKEHIEILLGHKKRTGKGPIALLKNVDSVPAGLRAPLIESWASGNTKTANEEFYNFTVQTYENTSDNQKNTRRPLRDANDRIDITTDILERIESYKITLPITLKAFLRYHKEEAEGLTEVKIAHILSGRNKTMTQAQLRFLDETIPPLLEIPHPLIHGKIGDHKAYTFEEIPPRAPNKSKKLPRFPGTEYVEITDDDYIALHTHRIRSGIAHKNFMKDDPDKPKGLRESTVSAWFRGITYSAEKQYLHYVMTKYESFPDKASCTAP